MQHDDLPLFQWCPPVQIIPFPSRHRTGYAAKIARQLSKARSNREADSVLSRAMEAHCRQMERARISPNQIDQQRDAFKVAIRIECERINAAWLPNIEPCPSSQPWGAA